MKKPEESTTEVMSKAEPVVRKVSCTANFESPMNGVVLKLEFCHSHEGNQENAARASDHQPGVIHTFVPNPNQAALRQAHADGCKNAQNRDG